MKESRPTFVLMQTALITGANRGLGLACARLLLKHGHQVIMTARDTNKLAEAISSLSTTENAKRILSAPCDVSDKDSILDLASYLNGKFDSLELLVNNAGVIGDKTTFPETSLQEMRQVMEINFFGPYLLTQSLCSLLTKSDQSMVINVSSQMGLHDQPASKGYTSYRVSKNAINGLSDVLNRELSPSGIEVCSVHPGWVHTDMGGEEAPLSPDEGAQNILAPFLNNLKGGKFYIDGKESNW